MMAYLKAVFCSYADLFFINNAVIAGIIICAVTFVHPQVALAGVIAVIAAYCFARILRMDKQFLELGYYTYNPLLVGMSLGYLFKLTTLSILFIVLAGIITFLLTMLLANLFMTYLRLPVLSFPFVIVSSLSYLASVHYTTLSLSANKDIGFMAGDFGLPFWLAGFFKAFGAVLFAPSVIVGIVLSVVILRHSRVLFLLALVGYYVGVSIHMLMSGSMTNAFADTNSFNYIFIAMAIGGIFLIPSISSYILAIIAVAISTVFMDAFGVALYYYGIPLFTLPFNVVTLSVVYVLGMVRHQMIPVVTGRNPEESLEIFLANSLRYRDQYRTLYLPFSGHWMVWQGFDGKWTHKGNWQYAYDFVITDENGKTHQGDGSDLNDYYCYLKPVLSPVRGRVINIVDDLPSNPIGDADENNRWGNLVIIQDPRGFYVEISHFAEKSIKVKKDDWIERGTIIGLCGNSGYSPQPHIHIQVQATEFAGDVSLPFSFVSYISDNEYQANNIPPEENIVEPLYRDRRIDTVTNFVLDDELCYKISRGEKSLGELKIKVKMAPDSIFYFESQTGKLYFGKHENTFYFYRITGNDQWLRLLFTALPRMPLAYREGLTWHDFIPQGMVIFGIRKLANSFFSAILPKLATVKVMLKYHTDTRIESTTIIGRKHKTAIVELDHNKGFARLEVNGIVFNRVL